MRTRLSTQAISLEERAHAEMLVSMQVQQQACVGPDLVSGLGLVPAAKQTQVRQC